MHHLIAQAPCLVADGGGWAADYVVRMEHLQGDMREVGGAVARRVCMCACVGCAYGRVRASVRVHARVRVCGACVYAC